MRRKSNSISYERGEGVIGLQFDSRSPKMNVNSPSSERMAGQREEGKGQVVQSSVAKMDEPRVIQNGLISISC